MIHPVRITTDDRLVQRKWNPDTKTMTFRGKRVAKDCPLSRDEIRAYVEYGAIRAISVIRNNRGRFGLKQALDLLNQARGENTARYRA